MIDERVIATIGGMMSEAEKTIWTIKLLGKFKKHGESVTIAARPGASAGSMKALIAEALRVKTGNDAVAALVGVAMLVSRFGVLDEGLPPPDDAELSIMPPACS